MQRPFLSVSTLFFYLGGRDYAIGQCPNHEKPSPQ